jgi:hypothetical protein
MSWMMLLYLTLKGVDTPMTALALYAKREKDYPRIFAVKFHQLSLLFVLDVAVWRCCQPLVLLLYPQKPFCFDGR